MKKNEVFICTGGELPDIWSIEKSTQGVRGQKTGRKGKKMSLQVDDLATPWRVGCS